MPPTPSKRAATLLFCHGAALCQDIWTPIITRLQQASLIRRAAPSMASFDFPYHGTRRNVSEQATLHLENPASPRVTHPAMHWPTWSREEVERQVHQLRAKEDSKSPLIGIGHSMGGAALWAAEAANPGMFDGLILFEPMVNTEQYYRKEEKSFLMSMALKRKAHWDSFEEAETEILSSRNFRRWHRESLKSYIKGAVVKVSPPESNDLDSSIQQYALSCPPHIEAALYSATAQLSADDLARVECPITFHYGARTQLFSPQYKQPLVDKYPHLYSMADAVPDSTHALVTEDIDTIVGRIVDSLQELPSFEPTSRI